ncbi:MAG: DUF899 family protein [Polyangiaceae bacterium]
MPVTYPGESAAYRAARDALLEEEIDLRRRMEAVAATRRALPPGGLVPEDYVFQGAGAGAGAGASAGGKPAPVRLSELFSTGNDSLAIYSMMFPRDPGDTRANAAGGETSQLPLQEAPCPSCVALLDQLDGAVDHVTPKMDLVIVAKAPIERVLTFARERGWRRLRIVSCAGNSYNRDYHGQNSEGAQRPMINVFSRDPAGTRHFWGSEMLYAPCDPGQDPRHVGTLEPMWNLFDMTREGRAPDWDEQLQYPPRPHCSHC